MSINLGAVLGRLVEIDQIAVKTDLWKRVKARDAEACKELAKNMDGTFLYLHALSLDDAEWTLITLREFQKKMPMFVGVRIEIGE